MACTIPRRREERVYLDIKLAAFTVSLAQTESGQNQRMWCSLSDGVLRLSPDPSAEVCQYYLCSVTLLLIYFLSFLLPPPLYLLFFSFLLLNGSSSYQPLHSVSMLHSTVRKARDSLLMDNKESSSSLSMQLSIQEEGQLQPLLIAPERPEDKVVQCPLSYWSGE